MCAVTLIRWFVKQGAKIFIILKIIIPRFVSILDIMDKRVTTGHIPEFYICLGKRQNNKKNTVEKLL